MGSNVSDWQLLLAVLILSAALIGVALGASRGRRSRAGNSSGSEFFVEIPRVPDNAFGPSANSEAERHEAVLAGHSRS